MYYREWTDPGGTTHLWAVGTGETLCGRDVGMHTAVPQLMTCQRCLNMLAVGREDIPIQLDQ